MTLQTIIVVLFILCINYGFDKEYIGEAFLSAIKKLK